LPLRGEIIHEDIFLILFYLWQEEKIMPLETLYNYLLQDVDGEIFSVTTSDTTSDVIREYQGYVLIGREVVGYRAILAD